MSDKSPTKERVFGESWNDKNPRGSSTGKGPLTDITVSPVQNLDNMKGSKTGSVKNLPNESA